MKVSGIPYIQGRNAYTDADRAKYGIAIHNTANDATARAEADYATRRTDGVSSHFYVDDTEVIQSLDTDSRAGHAGSNTGNENAVAVEITGTNDKSRDWWLDNVNWTLLGSVLAQVVAQYGVELRRASVSEMKSRPKVRAFYGHDDMRQAWAGTTHTDPGANFPWDRLFSAVGGEDVGACERVDHILETGQRPEGNQTADGGKAINWLVRMLGDAAGPGEPGDSRSIMTKIDLLLSQMEELLDRPPVDAEELAEALAGNAQFVQDLAAALAPLLQTQAFNVSLTGSMSGSMSGSATPGS